MRLVFGLVLMVMVWIAPAVFDMARAPAFSGPPPSGDFLVHKAKFVCGDTPEGYRCRTEKGAIRRGKMQKIPSGGSGQSSGGAWGGGGLFGGGSLWGGGDEAAEAEPAAPGAATGTAAAASGCPANTERLGGHCIPYTQTCNRGLAAGAAPQVCRSAQEKLICDFRADGLKDCCCRTYSQY